MDSCDVLIVGAGRAAALAALANPSLDGGMLALLGLDPGSEAN